MLSLESAANREGPIPLTHFGSGSFATEVCDAQNLAEQGRFAEAASRLSSLLANGTTSDRRRMLGKRIEILNKWAKSGVTEINDFYGYYLGNEPEWFHKRTRPIVLLWLNSKFPDVEKHFLLAEFLARKGDMRGQTLALLAIPQLPGVTEESSAEALLAAGRAFYRSGEDQQAESAWSRARHLSRATPAWVEAVYNLGIVERKRKNLAQALAYFEEVMGSRPDATEVGAHILKTYGIYSYRRTLEAYRIHSHRSALVASDCCEQMGDYRKSLHYAWLAKNQYPLRSWCGTCRTFEDIPLYGRIAYLVVRVYGVWVVTLALVVFGVYRYRRQKR